MNAEKLTKQVNELFRSHEYDDIKPLLLSYKDLTEHNNSLAIVCYLCTIHEREKESGQTTIFSKISDMEELLQRYTALKFYLRRIDFNMLDDVEMFYRFLLENRVSSYELLRAIDFSVVNKEKILREINDGLVQDETNKADSTNYPKCVEDSGIGTADNTEDAQNSDIQEVCFIICTNDHSYAQECIYYINHLNVPTGVRIDVLTVEKASSLASAYNEAMQCSNAKYKVYLHHDTFIINRDFISECLQIFRKNPQIGMIGNVGVKKMPASGVMWDADRYGMLYEQHIYETVLLANAFSLDLPYLEVEAIDGFLMVTQYDIPWRADLFDKWDFYDCSQSMEFGRRGYKVVIPNMKQPWCVHDCGFINLKNYDVEKEKFIAEYLNGRE